MFKKFLFLEWKAFSRSKSFATSLILKILMVLGAIYFSVCFLFIGVGAFYILKKANLEPLATVNKFLIYYLFIDLAIRYFFQKIPVMNIRPLLALPIKKATIVNFSLGKTSLSFFNWAHAFFFLPFTVVLSIEGYDILSVIFWHISIVALIYCNNFLNILINNKNNVFFVLVAPITALGIAQYYQIFNITDYTVLFFNGLFSSKWMFLIPVILLVGLYCYTFIYFKNNAYLDAGLANNHDVAKTENFIWFNQFGILGTFLKNDIKLIKRNKRSKTTIGMSVLFLFYGLIFFANPTQPEVMKIFAAIFVSGGFLFTFGQFVPSWDSSYYPLMMTQNIPYRNYLSSKWWLIVIGTVSSTVLASFYLFMGWQIYLTVLVGAIYNIGVNSHLVLLGGAYTKTPIDLSNTKGAFGDKKAFNVQTMLISLPKLLVPVILYAIGLYTVNANTGLALVAGAGILGFAFKDKVFTIVERIYRTEKYKTIEAYKQKT